MSICTEHEAHICYWCGERNDCGATYKKLAGRWTCRGCRSHLGMKFGEKNNRGGRTLRIDGRELKRALGVTR